MERMNHQHPPDSTPVFGSLFVDSLEDESEEIFEGANVEAPDNEGRRERSVWTAAQKPVPKNLMDAFSSSKKTSESTVESNSNKREAATKTDTTNGTEIRTIPLRQWIQQMLQSFGNNKCAAIVSQVYLESAIKIAIALTKQVTEAEDLYTKYGITAKVDLLPLNAAVANHWAKYAVVHVRESSSVSDQKVSAVNGHCSEQNQGQYQSPPFASASVGETEEDIDQQLKSFLELCDEEDGCQGGEADIQSYNNSQLRLHEFGWKHQTNEDGNPQDINQKIDSFLEAFEKQVASRRLNQSQPLVNTANSDNQGINANIEPSCIINFLDDAVAGSQEHEIAQSTELTSPLPLSLACPAANESTQSAPLNDQASQFIVESAEIKFPESEARGDFNNDNAVSKESSQRLFSLGLLFFELFSAGEGPVPNLHSLPYVEGAFISLSTMALVKKDRDGEDTIVNSSKRRQGPSKSERCFGLCQLSCEYLKLVGVSVPICQMILNMLEVVYGDFGGAECYRKITDVTADLQLMYDTPRFARGLDINSMSLELLLNEVVVPREEELHSIISCYHRCLLGSVEIALIKGESGSGKSWLAHRARASIEGEGGLFLTGKFDQMHQGKPFSALASSFDKYCDFLIRSKKFGWVKIIADSIRASLGQDVLHLVQMIPKLGVVLDIPPNTSAPKDSCSNAIQRLHYLLCQFVDVISNNSISLTLCIDDCQWADEASVAVLHSLIRQGCNKFFFIGCYRDDEMENDHAFMKMLESTCVAGVHTSDVKLNGISEEALNNIVSHLLCLSPRLVRQLSHIVYSKTKGNILFFSQLMLSLHRDGLLQIDFGLQRWIWDEEKIMSVKLPDNVAICFTNHLRLLPVDVQLALFTLSTFGASAKSEHLNWLEKQLNMTVLGPLKRAAAEGLVSNIKGSYTFMHDRIQEASYNCIGLHRGTNHLTYGRCLAEMALNTDADDDLFVAVNQINLGGIPSAASDRELFTFANLNLLAGKRAMAMSDFMSAYTLFNHGISFLSENHWQRHYSFSLELFELATQTSLANGNMQALRVLSSEVFENSRSFVDSLSTHYTVMTSLGYGMKLDQALQSGLEILSQLGEGIPNYPTKAELDRNVQHTQSLIRGIGEDDILNYRLMTDTRKLYSLKFLGQLQIIAHTIQPSLSPLLVMKMVQITMLHGLSPASPIGFVCFGSYLAKLGNITSGYTFAKLAKSLVEKLGAKDVEGAVDCALIEVQCYIEPVQACLDLFVNAERLSLSRGDIYWACLNRLQYVTNCFWSGLNLDVVNKTLDDAQLFFEKQGPNARLLFVTILQRTAKRLMGSTDLNSLNRYERLMQECTAPRQKISWAVHNLYLSFMFRDGNLQECCTKLIELEAGMQKPFLVFCDSNWAIFGGLASFQIYRENGRDPSWLGQGRTRKQSIQLWANEGCSWNFQPWLQLMEAEEHFSNGNYLLAKESYKSSIACAQSRRFVNVEALAAELAAKFFFDTGDFKSSLEHFNLAHQKYLNWGCMEKACSLFAYMNEIFGNYLSQVTSVNAGNDQQSMEGSLGNFNCN